MIKKLLPLLLVACVSTASATEAQEQTDFIQSALASIPSELTSMMRITSIKFKNLNPSKTTELECQTGETFGYTKKTSSGYEVVLDQSVPKLFWSEGVLSNCAHKNPKTLATAVLAHELSHVLNFEKKLTSQTTFKRAFSFILEDRSHHRSPDEYEFTSSSEAFAVNTEHFLLDPDYGCRRPTLDRYFRNIYPSLGKKKQECSSPEVRVGDLSSGLQQFLKLDPKRVYQIHYLLAGPGKEASSLFGHSMLRIVQCSEQRDAVSEKCLSDIRDHVVVSFRAKVSGATMNNIDGLTGKYPSQIFLLSMADVITDYNISEDRELFSIPIDLSSQDIETFLSAVQEVYWGYSGSYKFLTNNCATETFALMQNAFFDRSIAKAQPGLLTPHEVLRNFHQFGLAETSDLNILRNKKKGQLYFPPFLRSVEEGLKRLQQSGLLASNLTLDKLAKKPSLLNGQSVMDNLDSLEKKEKRQAIVGLIALQDFIQRKTEALWQTEISRQIDRHSLSNQQSDFEDMTKLLLKLEPAQVAPLGYGIPAAHEVLPVETQIALLQEIGAKKMSLMVALKEVGSAQRSGLENRIADAKEVKRQLLQKLKQQ